MNIKFYNSKDSEEDKFELERFQQANDFVSGSVVFDSPRKPGGYTKKYGNKFSKLSELKPHHFDWFFRPEFISRSIQQNIYYFNKEVWKNSNINFIFKF